MLLHTFIPLSGPVFLATASPVVWGFIPAKGIVRRLWRPVAPSCEPMLAPAFVRRVSPMLQC